jgi:subtilisin-like proprotein convertase family protein
MMRGIQRLSVASLLVLISCTVAVASLDPAHEKILETVVDEVLNGETEGVRVVASPDPMESNERYEFMWSGGRIELPPETAWFALADETPGTFGYHPVKHVFFDRDLRILEIRDAIFYPRIYRDGKRIDPITLIEYRAKPGPIPTDREAAESRGGAESSVTDFSYNEFYAVIIEGDVPSGSSYSEFWSDNVRMFRILLEYGYQAENIHVLYGEGNDETEFNCPYYHETMVDYAAYNQDVRNLFTWMRDGNPGEGIAQVTDQDFIYLFTFDHGGSSGGCDATLCLMDGCMPDTEFASYFNQIPYKHRAVNMQQCHSGGFIDNLENTTTVISTAANCTESAYEADEQDDCGGGVVVKYGEWNYWWMSAMEGHLPWPGEQPVDVDANFDGKVSFLEAHNYAVANDNRPEHPLWSDLGGLGDELSLNTIWAGAHLYHAGHTIDDSTGNVDGIPDAGETVVMPVTLGNNGEEDAIGISGTLSTDNSWITIHDDHATYPDIYALGGTGESLPDYYEWSSHADTPDDTAVGFRIDWISNGGTYSGNTQFFEKIVRVILEVQQNTVQDDQGGNGDGVADPGESIRLAVTLRNKGHATARQVHGTLTTASPYATVTDGDSDFEDVYGQGSGRSLSPHFGLDIDPATPDKTWIDCTLDVTCADGYSFTLPLRFMVGSRGTVLLIDDGDPGNADMLETLLDDLGFGVERELAGDTDPDSWSGYTMLVWAAGGNYNPVANPSHRTALEEHVAQGRKLLIEGGEIGYDHRNNTSFRQNVLHMDGWVAHRSNDLHVMVDDHPISTVPALLDETIGSLATNNGEGDTVYSTGDATTVLDWTGRPGSASVIAYDDDPLEGNGGQIVGVFTACDTIDETNGQRRQVMENSLEWLVGNDLPYLVLTGHLVIDDDLGNADGVVDPGETVHLSVMLSNRGSSASTDTWARATTDHPLQIAFVDNYAEWPVIQSGVTATSLAPHLVLRVAEDTPCGTVVQVTLEIANAEGFHATRLFSFKVGTGGGQHATYPSTDTPKAIPNPGVADSVLDIDTLFRIGDVNCQVDIQHSSTSLIKITLESPEGTTVVLHDGEDVGNEIRTTYDSQTLPHGPGSMSDYDGEIGTGDWHLYVEDLSGDMMLGIVNDWSLIFDTADLCHEQTCGEPVPGEVADSLTVDKISGTDIHMEWGPVTGASGYNIWRSGDPQMSGAETAGSSPVTSFDELGLPQTQSIFFYQVKAENACREEGP